MPVGELQEDWKYIQSTSSAKENFVSCKPLKSKDQICVENECDHSFILCGVRDKVKI